MKGCVILSSKDNIDILKSIEDFRINNPEEYQYFNLMFNMSAGLTEEDLTEEEKLLIQKFSKKEN